MERQKREHRLGLWIQRQISDMKMANNLLPVIEKLARQKQKTKCGRGKEEGRERGKETDTAMITAKIHSNNFITNLHLFCFFSLFLSLVNTFFSLVAYFRTMDECSYKCERERAKLSCERDGKSNRCGVVLTICWAHHNEGNRYRDNSSMASLVLFR